MTNIKSYLKQNKKRILGELLEFLSIPSVSAQVKYKKDVAKTAKFVADKLKEAGGQNIKNNKIYARGSSDDKGQVFIHIKAFEYLLKEKKMHTNIKFVIEGEEEISSVNLEKFIRDHKQKLKADTTLISDTEILNENTPSITTGLRGLAYFEVEIIGPNRDLHSGLYGGAVANPINTLCEMIAKLKNKNKKITIPGFYDGVKLSLKEKNEITKIPFNLKKYQKQ